MLTAHHIARCSLERKCVLSLKELEAFEFIASREKARTLYDHSGSSNNQDSKLVKTIDGSVESVLEELPDEETRNTFLADLKKFMELVLRNGSYHKEDYVHRYLYQYWNELDRPKHTTANFTASYFKGRIRDGEQSPIHRVIKKIIGEDKAFPDIIAINMDMKTLWVIDVKNESLSSRSAGDRALGQILRYYQIARHQCDVGSLTKWRVVPVLVAKDCDSIFWDSIPTYFREFLELFHWKSHKSGGLSLVDGKDAIKQTIRGRPFKALR